MNLSIVKVFLKEIAFDFILNFCKIKHILMIEIYFFHTLIEKHVLTTYTNLF